MTIYSQLNLRRKQTGGFRNYWRVINMTERVAEIDDVSPEFIEENRGLKLCTTRQGGPYSKGQRRKRRSEVYRLHFEQGLPAIQIAELMNVNRNTINDDIRWLYEKMSADIEGDEFNGYFTKQLVRIETQRTRLMSYLSETKDLDKKLVIERQLTDMDFRLAAMVEKFKENTFTFWDEVTKAINRLAESEGLKHGYSTVYELQKIPKEKRRMIDKALEEQEKRRDVGKGEPSA